MFKNPDQCNVKRFKSLTTTCHQQQFEKDISSQSSLMYYRIVKENTFLSKYLMSRSIFKTLQLKFKLRCGVSGLGEDLYRQKRGLGLCKHCGAFEIIKHMFGFLYYCLIVLVFKYLKDSVVRIF